MSELPAMPAWTVTQQTETTDLGPGGAYVAGVRVTFRTAAGVTLSVFVPQDQYTVAGVAAAIAAKAAVADAVHALEG